MELKDDYKKKECISGVIYSMSPSAGFQHANVNGNIYAKLHSQLRNSLCKAYIENAYLYMDETNKEYVIPDIMIVCDTKLFKNGTSRYYGVPKFVVETLSPSTAKKDKTVKKDFYQRKGVSEYWIIDYKSKSVEIYYLTGRGYELEHVYMLQSNPDEEAYNAKEVIALREFPDISFILDEIFYDIDMD